MPGSGKLAGGIRIKEDCKCDYAEAGEKCDIHDRKGSELLIMLSFSLSSFKNKKF